MVKLRRRLVAFGAASVLTLLVSAPAMGSQAEVTNPLDTLGIATANAPEGTLGVLVGVAGVPTDTSGESAIDASLDGVQVTIPNDPTTPIMLIPQGGEPIGLSVPFGNRAVNAKVLAEGVVAYDNRNGSTTVPVVKEDGSVQVVTVIDVVGAPTSYTYALDLPQGSRIDQEDEGGLLILGPEGEFLGGVAPAWAIDANGIPVATHYTVSGTEITQVVDHTSSAIQYPVVADPWLGVDLYYTPWVSFVSKGYKINVTPRAWGVANAGLATWWAHRDEVKTKLGGSVWRWTNSIQEQFYCHIAGLPLSLPTYNMESWRPTMNWATQAPYNCNYPEGGWGSL